MTDSTVPIEPAKHLEMAGSNWYSTRRHYVTEWRRQGTRAGSGHVGEALCSTDTNTVTVYDQEAVDLWRKQYSGSKFVVVADLTPCKRCVNKLPAEVQPVADPTRSAVEVRVGQVWADNDKRSEGRHVLVVGFVEDAELPHLKAVVVPCDRDGKQTGERRTQIRVSRFKPTRTGYRLVKDAEVRP